jgi:hypothetical protein
LLASGHGAKPPKNAGLARAIREIKAGLSDDACDILVEEIVGEDVAQNFWRKPG